VRHNRFPLDSHLDSSSYNQRPAFNSLSRSYAHEYQPAVVTDLLEAVKLLKPSALIGVRSASVSAVARARARAD